MGNGRTTDRPQGLDTNRTIVMKLNYTSLSVLLLLPLLVLQESKAFEIDKLNDGQAVSEIEDQVASLSAEDREVMAKSIYESKRMELNLKAIQVPTLPMESIIMQAPPSDFRSRLAIRILKSDEHWSMPLVAGSSGVGSRYQRSLTICDAIVSPYYQEGEIDWNGPLTNERRTQIANSFERLLTEESREGDSPSSRQENQREGVIPTPEPSEKTRMEAPLSDEKSLEGGGPRLFVVLIASLVALIAIAFSILLFRKGSRRPSDSR